MMRRDCFKRISALLLALVMTLSMSCFAFVDVFAEDGESAEADSVVEITEEDGDQAVADETGDADEVQTQEQDQEILQDGSADVNEPVADPVDTGSQENADKIEPSDDVSDGDTADENDAAEGEDAEAGDSQEETQEEPQEIGVIEGLKAVPDGAGNVVLTWTAFEEAVSYISYAMKDGKTAGQESSDIATCTISGLDGLTTVYVEALDADGNIIAASEKIAVMTFDESFRKAISSRTIKSPVKLKSAGVVMDLRKIIGQIHSGYAVVQGGCTDGTHAYYLMVSSKTQKGIVAKVRMSDNKLVKKSSVLNIHHGNGMAYDSKRNLLVVIAREDRRQEITCIDANSLKIKRQEKVKYSYYNGKNGTYTAAQKDYGIAAIAYSERYDCYITLMRTDHELMIFDPDSFQAIGLALTKINANYPGVYQAMDADDRYVYLVLSSDGNRQKSNLIIALDWNSEKLLPVVNGEQKYIKSAWKCSNKGDGSPDAVIKIGTSHEAENIFHVTGSDGKEHFYLSEYYNNPQYKWVYKKVAYKVKWKKVTKKVKWKKVKGKWKYKKKKVWKYKKKYKKVKTKVLNYYNRNNYVYDLGMI